MVRKCRAKAATRVHEFEVAGRCCRTSLHSVSLDRSIVRSGRLFSEGPLSVVSVFLLSFAVFARIAKLWHVQFLAVLSAHRFSVVGCGCAHPDGASYWAAVIAVPRGRAPRCSVFGLAARCRELVVASGCRQQCMRSCGDVRVV